MATKLKNISKSKGARLIALLLAVLLFASSGYFASMFFKSGFVYNSFDNRPFSQTAAFNVMLNDFEDSAIYEGQILVLDSIEEFEKTSIGREIKNGYDTRKKTAESSYDLLDKSGIGIYVTKGNKYRYRLEYNGELYYFTYNGEQISEDEFYSYDYIRSNESEHVAEEPTADSVEAVSFEKPEAVPLIAPVVEDVTSAVSPYDEINQVDTSYIGKISDALKFIFNTTYNGYNLNYGEISREAFMISIENTYRQSLEDSYLQHKSIPGDYYGFENITSIRYAVKFTGTGKIFTNCGVSATDTRDSILKKLGGELVDSFENGKHVPAERKTAKSDGFFAQIYYDLSEDSYASALTYLGMLNGDDVEWAYFSYHPSAESDGIVTVSNELFDSHSEKKIKSVNFCLFAALICLAIASAIGIWLIASAGKTENGETVLCFFDKLPFELNLALAVCTILLCGYAVTVLGYFELCPSNLFSSGSFEITLARIIGTASSEITALLVAIFFITQTLLLMSVARNVRAKTFAKHTLCRFVFMPFVWLFKKIKLFFGNLKYIFAADYSNGKAKKFRTVSALAVTAFFVINALLAIFGYAFGDEIGALLLIIAIILDLAAIVFCIFVIVSADKIMHTVSDIRRGDTDAKINTEHMPIFLKNFSEDITSIGDGLKEAVDSAVKDQRMKAELITNVSHDLKTPLTSIVSYVDLLKRCNVENEDANRYITILDEKAHRMKKLIEDLVEASKASSGAMEIHPMKINLCEFAAQAVGEHEDELKAHGIDIVLSIPNVPVNVKADPMKISRVVENLFSNIRKYALEGTRVYADVSEIDEYAVLTIKNISKNALNVPAEELMQRFVRGDSSRTGEGSGLGLSIAKNLCELQNGKFSISVDGDLFKAVVELPKA